MATLYFSGSNISFVFNWYNKPTETETKECDAYVQTEVLPALGFSVKNVTSTGLVSKEASATALRKFLAEGNVN